MMNRIETEDELMLDSVLRYPYAELPSDIKRSRIIKTLRAGITSPLDISRFTNLSMNSVNYWLRKLVRDHVVQKVRPGCYRMRETPPPLLPSFLA